MKARGLDLGKFAEPAVLVLVSLTDAPKHGYAIMADVEVFSGARMGPGTLYAVLARLEEAGYVEALRTDDRRRPYRITSSGNAALEEHLARMDQFLVVGLDRLRARPRATP